MKRLLVLFIILNMGLCFASGETEADVNISDTTENITISMYVPSHPNWPYQKDWIVERIINEETGINLDVQSVMNDQYGVKVSLAIAGGTLPDIIFSSDSAHFKEEGLLGTYISISNQLNTGKMPNYKKIVEQDPGGVSRHMTAEGKLFCVGTTGMGETNRRGWLFREDVFQKHDLKVPVTYDELYDICKKLKSIYPESYPFAFRGGLGHFYPIVESWNTYTEIYYNYDTKKWSYEPFSNNYRAMLEFYKKLYDEELIPPNWLSLSTKEWENMITTDLAFITVDYLVRIDKFNSTMRTQQPDFTIAYMEPLAGGYNGVNKSTYTATTRAAMGIASNSEVIDPAVKLLDWMCSDEGSELLSWGREGETFTISDGTRKWIDCKNIGEIRSKYGLSTNGFYLAFDYDAHMATASSEFFTAVKTDQKFNRIQQPILAYTEAESEFNQTKRVEIRTKKDEIITKFLLGTRSFDEWDDYKQEITNLGIDEVIELDQKVYTRMNTN